MFRGPSRSTARVRYCVPGSPRKLFRQENDGIIKCVLGRFWLNQKGFLYRIKRGLAGYVSYLAACGMKRIFQ